MIIHPGTMSRKVAANRQQVIGFTKVLCASVSRDVVAIRSSPSPARPHPKDTIHSAPALPPASTPWHYGTQRAIVTGDHGKLQLCPIALLSPVVRRMPAEAVAKHIGGQWGPRLCLLRGVRQVGRIIAEDICASTSTAPAISTPREGPRVAI
ncbi:hypothetical protein C8Q74DRAFT_989335 [Fomes fomentarius]|nr:hypothetical protein C8Q74DRAFT_989335 [Fomes fomentarius]